MKTLLHQTALIISADEGSGPAIAERYAALGANIVIHHVNNDFGIQQLISNIKAMGVKVIAHALDINHQEDFNQLFAVSKNKFKKISIVVINNTGTPIKTDRIINKAAEQVADHGRIIYATKLDRSQQLRDIMEPISSAAIKHAEQNITINAIISQPKEQAIFKQKLSDEEIADAAEFFASDLADLITAQYLVINGIPLLYSSDNL
jgi:3-oxoacyl-[acyl-carrier protein] reductase